MNRRASRRREHIEARKLKPRRPRVVNETGIIRLPTADAPMGDLPPRGRFQLGRSQRYVHEAVSRKLAESYGGTSVILDSLVDHLEAEAAKREANV